MKENFLNTKKGKIHLIGIGGVSMSALAKFLSVNGYAVTGSDTNYSEQIKRLEERGITVCIGHSAKNVKGANAVIYSSAISEDNPELVKAKIKKIPVYKRSEVLGRILETFKKAIAVSGSHGKTTTTAMLAHTLICASKNPTVFLGGESAHFSNFLKGGKEFAVAEACEYKKNFLDIKPDISVVLNIDNDHLDSFGSMEDMQNAFSGFVAGSVSFINADDKRASSISNPTTLTFGIENIANYSARNIKFNGRGYSFSVYAYSIPLGKIELSIMGKHNIYNALATVAVCDYLKIPFCFIKSSLENFNGVKRRLEYLGKIDMAECFADYAHHPREIKATIDAFRELDKPFAVIFQPHTYSRTKFLMKDFVNSLFLPDTVIYKTYPARENFDKDGCAYALYENLLKDNKNSVFYCENEHKLEEIVQKLAKKYSALLFLGAGDIYEIAKSIIKKLK